MTTYQRICKVVFQADDPLTAVLADIEHGMRFGSAAGATREDALVAAVDALIGGAGGILTQDDIDSGCLLVVGGDEPIDTPIAGFDLARAQRVIAACRFGQ